MKAASAFFVTFGLVTIGYGVWRVAVSGRDDTVIGVIDIVIGIACVYAWANATKGRGKG